MRRNSGAVIWMTGLSGAGKTTVSRELARALGESGHAVETLDGDEVREHLSRGLGFSKADRDTNVRRIGFVARVLARNGVVALVAAISPYRDARAEVRRAVEADGVPFLEVFVDCPLGVLVARDVKGLYARAILGEITHFTGVSDPYEEPLSPDVVISSAIEPVEASAARVLSRLVELGVVDADALDALEGALR